MTLFGTALGGKQIASLVGLLAMLVVWLGVLGRQRDDVRGFKARNTDRKAGEDTVRRGRPGPPDEPRTGPWG